MFKKVLVSFALAVFVSMIAACSDSSGENSGENAGSEEQQSEESGDSEKSGNSEDSEDSGSESESSDSSQQSSMPEPETENIPDVVATVNGEEISGEEFTSTYKSRFQRMAMQYQMTGKEMNQDELKQQVADSMVGAELLSQEADNRGIEASEEQINSTLSDLVKQNNLESQDKLMSTLKEQQGMSEEEVRNQVANQVKVDQLISEEAGDIEPTEEELKQAYEKIKAQQQAANSGGSGDSSSEDSSGSENSEGSESGGESSSESSIPSFEEMKPDLKTQVKNQKESQATQTLVKKLREEADVSINL